MQLTLGLEDLANIVTIASPLVTGLFMAVDWMIKRRMAEHEAKIRERITRIETLLEEQQRRLDRLEQRVDMLGAEVYRLRSRLREANDPEDPPSEDKQRKEHRRLYELLASLMGSMSLAFVFMNIVLIYALIVTALRQGLGAAAVAFYAGYIVVSVIAIWAGLKAASLAYRNHLREALPYFIVDLIPYLLLYTILALQKLATSGT